MCWRGRLGLSVTVSRPLCRRALLRRVAERRKRRALWLLGVRLSQDTGSGHAASLRLEPECSANAQTLSAGCMGQVGHRGWTFCWTAGFSLVSPQEVFSSFSQWGN